MSPQVGRPKSDNPKSNDIKVRIDNENYHELLKYCEQNKITKAEAIRKGIYLLLKNKNK